MDAAGVALVLIGPGSVDQVCIAINIIVLGSFRTSTYNKRLLRMIFALVSIGVPTS